MCYVLYCIVFLRILLSTEWLSGWKKTLNAKWQWFGHEMFDPKGFWNRLVFLRGTGLSILNQNQNGITIPVHTVASWNKQWISSESWMLNIWIVSSIKYLLVDLMLHLENKAPSLNRNRPADGPISRQYTPKTTHRFFLILCGCSRASSWDFASSLAEEDCHNRLMWPGLGHYW